MVNSSGTGFVISLVADTTYPQGVELSQFASDSDPFDLPDITYCETEMGLNGDLIIKYSPQPININISVIANSDDNTTLNELFEANRPGKNRTLAYDNITLTGIYPDGSKITLKNGVIMGGTPGKAVTSGGGLKTVTYNFSFENKD